VITGCLDKLIASWNSVLKRTASILLSIISIDCNICFAIDIFFFSYILLGVCEATSLKTSNISANENLSCSIWVR